MNKKTDLEELEKKIDFPSVSKKLASLTESGALKRRKTLADLLDKIKPALLQARASKVSLQALTTFLVNNHIPVSEPTLRKYLNSAKKSKRNRTNRPGSPAAKPASLPSIKISSTASETPTKKLPPRYARQQEKSA